jgi:hypothetical protein
MEKREEMCRNLREGEKGSQDRVKDYIGVLISSL